MSEQNIKTKADVVIIGGGIAGVSTAWYLNKAGLKVVICEKATIACEQSSRNWGWIRQQGRDNAELPIVMESMNCWQEIADDVDIDIGYRREGAIYLCENEAELANHDRFYNLASQFGLETNRLTRTELTTLIKDCPARWKYAIHTPSDGRAEPALAVPAMATTLRQRGVEIRENCAVLEIETTNGKASGVKTESGYIQADQVVVCAGAWSTFMLQKHNILLPQITVKASVGRTAKAPNIFNGNASGSQIAFRRRLDGGYNVAMTAFLEFFPSLNHVKNILWFQKLARVSAKKLRPRFPEINIDGDISKNRVLDPKPSTDVHNRIRRIIDDRLPALKNVELLETWSGMIDALPDVVPVMDQAPDTSGLWIATGFSGHGFGIGPAAGKIMSELIQGNDVDYDLNRFRISRFTDGSPMILGPAI